MVRPGRSSGKDRRRLWAIKGKAGSLPIWPRRPSRNNKGRVNLFTVGVDTAKEAIYSRLRGVKEPGPGYCHFPLDRDVGYFEQLTAEKKRVRYSKGFPVHYWWKPDGKRNEALDIRVYGYTALLGLISMGLQLNKRAGEVSGKHVSGDGNKPVASALSQRRCIIHSAYMDR
jgi:phage terminase large subunit GpA-like protein